MSFIKILYDWCYADTIILAINYNFPCANLHQTLTGDNVVRISAGSVMTNNTLKKVSGQILPVKSNFKKR
jgi:hypothetical protein